MAKIKLDPLFREISGKLGDVVFRSTANGVVMSKRPAASSVPPSEAQNAHRQRFKEAAAYARTALADPQVSSLYQQAAAGQNKSAYNLAVADYMKGRNLLAKPGG